MTINPPENSEEFKKWWATLHPERCSCGNKIDDRSYGIGGIDVCRECFNKETKHWKFKERSAS